MSESPAKPPAVIFDRDGTLASVAHVRPTDRDNESWANFNAAIRFDAPSPVVVALWRAINPEWAKIVVSGRDGTYRAAMADWLEKHDLTPYRLYMRAAGDRRLDSIVKEEILVNQILPSFDVRLAIDDRPQVCEVWERYGIPVIRVSDPAVPPPITQQRPERIFAYRGRGHDHYWCSQGCLDADCEFGPCCA